MWSKVYPAESTSDATIPKGVIQLSEKQTKMETFDSAVDKLLKANPVVVKAAMEQEKKERAEERRAKHKEIKHDD